VMRELHSGHRQNDGLGEREDGRQRPHRDGWPNRNLPERTDLDRHARAASVRALRNVDIHPRIGTLAESQYQPDRPPDPGLLNGLANQEIEFTTHQLDGVDRHGVGVYSRSLAQPAVSAPDRDNQCARPRSSTRVFWPVQPHERHSSSVFF
jgi:hypothetical protein